MHSAIYMYMHCVYHRAIYNVHELVLHIVYDFVIYIYILYITTSRYVSMCRMELPVDSRATRKGKGYLCQHKPQAGL